MAKKSVFQQGSTGAVINLPCSFACKPSGAITESGVSISSMHVILSRQNEMILLFALEAAFTHHSQIS